MSLYINALVAEKKLSKSMESKYSTLLIELLYGGMSYSNQYPKRCNNNAILFLCDLFQIKYFQMFLKIVPQQLNGIPFWCSS